MKCINMNVGVILFFITTFISIESSTVRENKTKVINEGISKNKFDEGCLDLVKMIHNNDLSNYTINCKAISAKSQEDILQHACFVVKNMFNVVCNKEFNEATLNLLGRENIANICPFDFSHLQTLGVDFVFINHESVKTLASKDDCERVCYKFHYFTNDQCILLSKFNNYIRIQNTTPTHRYLTLPHPDLVKLPASPQVADTRDPMTAKTAASEPNIKEHLLGKNKVNSIAPKTRTETVANQVIASDKNTTEVSKKDKKEEKPVLTTTPKEEMQATEKIEAPQVDMKVPEVDGDKPVSKSNDRLPEDEFSNEEDLPKMDDSLLNNGVVSQDSDSQKLHDLEDKGTPYLKEKNSYVGEGFSQAEDSHFFFYFIMMSSIVVVGYLAFHNKNKILAYALEGSSGRRSRRRPNPARYRKLETNLEEVISSSATNATTSSVVY